SIAKSKIAGLIGIGFVMVFMVVYYRVPGLIANLALIIYGIILFALFKAIPITLTLAGIAGFILSIGMAVDANILIFERTKEELKAGRTLFTAINSGFDRAFTSIFDSNMTTIITCMILYCLGTSIVKGFALTLAVGVVVSMFSAITVTKNFMHLVFGTENLKNPALFGLKKEEIGAASNVVETKRENAKFGILD
ncbi:SecD/SecF family protein translocase subunit, partial [bacterium]|nr:SecD/SecF family protein translocase subunit [bacterium]